MPKTRLLFAHLFNALALSAALSHAQQAPVSREAPAIYTEAIAPLLTPLDQALELSKALPADPEFGGAVVLNEIVHHVDEAGARVIAIHTIYRADSEAGAESLERDTQSFRSATQKIHLALAQTISADGERTPVRPNATLIQSPQRNSDQSLYSDAQELVVIYPKIKVGTLTESIVVIEEESMRVPGEFMTSVSWSSGWPQARKRLVLDLPGELGARLRFSAIGSGTPKPQRSEPGGGRVRFELAQDRSPGYLWEIGRAPVSQAGPVTWMTTFADWVAFADWYRPLIRDRARLKPALASMVDQWTRDLKDEDEIVARLLRHASNDVRYTGLEFGIASLQPYDCNEVWENQYGDCKDKANLLRAMLAHKGIRSYLALVNTDHAGRIEKRSPDYRQFNHAILAVQRQDGSLNFCDPTIEFAQPGVLAPSSSGRDVLVIRDDSAEFTRTPANSAGHLDYHFDLDMSPGREIAGWLTLTATGNYGSSYGSFFSKKDPQALNQSIAGIIRDFYPTAEVADVERPDWDGGDYKLRAYFIAPGRDARKQSLTFPQASSLFPNLGDTKERLTSYYGTADRISVEANILVPAGPGAAHLPAPLGVDSSPISATASWETEAGTNHYRGKLEIVVKKPLLSAEEFQVAFGALTSIRSWLSTPLIFDKSAAAPTDTAQVELDNFPLMPTAQGQLNLLDQRFPADADPEKRRAALHKVRQFFPTDQKIEFFVESNLAELDWNGDEPQQAIDRLLKLLNSAASDAVDDEEIAWAEYVLAFCYRDTQKPDKAKALFKEIADNSDVSDFRRGWSGYQRLSLLKAEGDPDYSKLSAETNALLDFETEARAYLVGLHCDFMVRAGKTEPLQARLDALVSENPRDLNEIIELVIAVARELPTEESAALRAVISKLPVVAGSPAAETLATELESLREFRKSAEIYAEIQEKLKAFVDENRPDDWDSGLETGAEILDELEGDGSPEIYLRLVALHLTASEPDDRFPYFLWRMAAYSEFAERTGLSVFKKPVLPLLLDLCEQLPEGDTYFLEGRFLRAKVLGLADKLDEEIAIYDELFESGKLTTDTFIVAATLRLGTALERQEKFTAARDRYLSLKKYTQDFATANDALLRATLISLELGERELAIELIGHLAKTKNETLDSTPFAVQIRSLIDLGDQATAYWDATEKWWPIWEKLYAKLLPNTEPKALKIAAPGELRAFGMPLRAAHQAKDAAAFYPQADVLLRALRWSPYYLSDSASTLTFLAPNLNPEAAGGFRALVIAICENMPGPSGEAQRQLQLYHSLSLVDSDRPEEALKITEQFFAAAEAPRDPLYYSMVRIRAISAGRIEGADLDTPAKALEEVLATTDNEENRVQNILYLANLYNQLDRAEDEEKLLARELENPLIRGDESATARLTARYQSLAREGSGAKNFTTAADAWLNRHAPAWLASCPPLDLDDPRIGEDLEQALEQADARFTVEESVKLSVLAARSEKLGLDQREKAFLSAFSILHFDAPTHRQARAMLTSVLDQDGFPSSLKQIAIFGGLDSAAANRRPGEIAFLLTHPALDRDNERLSDLIVLYGHLAATNFNSAESISKLIKLLASDGMSSAELGVTLQVFPRLLELGELAEAEATYKSCGNWRLDADVNATNNAVKLNLLKVLKQARKAIPANARLHAELAPLLQLDTVEEPAWYSQRRDFSDLTDLSIADAKQLRLYQVKTKDFDQTDPSYWFDVADAIHAPGTVDFAYKLLEIFLRETDDDIRRASAAFFAPSIVDTDEPSVRDRLREIFAPYRDLADAPLTRDAIRIYEIRTEKLRTGQAIDIDQAFGSLNHPATARLHTRAKLTELIQREDKAQLRQYLDRMDADRMLDLSYLDLTLTGLKLAGMADEAELASEAAIEKIPALIAEGWRTPGRGGLATAYQLATLLDDPALIPDEPFEALQKHGIRNERDLLALKMAHYRLKRDWPMLETAADEAIQKFPTFYSFYLEKARALYHQDKKKAAGEPLRVFLKYSADDVEFTPAKRWLEEASAGNEP